MDKYEFNIKVDQMKKRVSEGDYATAMKIADGIDWSRVRNTNLLSMAATIYEENGEIQEAKDKLLLAFERAPIGKRLLYKLTELSVKSGDLEEAEDYYHEFADLAPDDGRILLLQYMIQKAQNAPVDQLISALEQYTAQDPDERWLYELATVYDEANRPADCIRICDRIALLFGEDAYAEKAMRLKEKYLGAAGQAAAYGYGYGNAYGNADAQEAYSYENAEAGAQQENAYAYDGAYAEYGAADGFTGGAEIRQQTPASYGAEAGLKIGTETVDEGGSFDAAIFGGAARVESADGAYEEALASLRYDNEDEAFEAYVRAHHMDEPQSGAESAAGRPERKAASVAAKAAEPEEEMPEVSVSYDDSYVNDGFSERLSKEVERLSAMDNHAEADLGGETRVIDADKIERLRKIVIRDDEMSGAAQAVVGDAAHAKKQAAKQAAALVSGLTGAAALAAAEAAKSAEASTAAVSGTAAASVMAAGAAAGQKAAAAAAEKTAETVVGAAAAAAGNAVKSAESVREVSAVPVQESTARAAVRDTAAEPKAADGGNEMRLPKKPTPQARPSFTNQTETAKTSAHSPVQARAAQPVGQKAEQKASAALPENKPQARYHMIIEAESKEAGLAIALDELRQLHRAHGITNAVAKTTAQKLNQRGLSAAAIEKIRGKDFIIEEAGALSETVMDEIDTLLRTDRSGMIIVMIDVPEGLDRMEALRPQLFELCDLVSDFEEEYEEDGAEIVETEEASDAEDCEEADAAEEDDAAYGAEDEADAYADEVYDDTEEVPDDDEYDAYEAEDEAEYDDADGEEDAFEDEPEDVPVRGRAEKKAGKAQSGRGAAGKRADQTRQNNLRAKEPADGEEMEIDDFAQYCCQYAGEIDCSITGKSMLALYERIELMEEDGIPLTKQNAEDLIEEAADRAEKPPFGKRIKSLFHSKYDKNGMLILKEEDFIS